ncbi:MAG: hypothetical protein UW07_C0008G0024 [Candidatus Nomurabacteria bacterium GW2011_GWF2_43_8]|uniref:Uncharacterized protein n=3 Tax=Candidatus Nomuraibacteriota TaxID=1752729 RepID=A0A0G1HYT7_9BACT|nr:MAG: hypothetical protein UV76_C0015G0009 [Candidatus Nomurabacteria bacterium GW2011_GWA2_43_15]KKT19359.1 MAG: hypothetical protein UW02_C0011G0010 [Candidatus Nomurabacteria bacterium GW2011_GWB1_43_7]KKT24802.1 MAG: hypothetical protein UW07_C0008G0024 [Candidatus Nomurabacteria bacterium GW2011_GWF2_43_8]
MEALLPFEIQCLELKLTSTKTRAFAGAQQRPGKAQGGRDG